MNGTILKPDLIESDSSKWIEFREFTSAHRKPEVLVSRYLTDKHIESGNCASTLSPGKTDVFSGLARNVYEYHKDENDKWYQAIDTGIPLMQMINEKRLSRSLIRARGELHWKSAEDLLRYPDKAVGLDESYDNLPLERSFFERKLIACIRFILGN